jgi:hypothetical protein
MSIFRQVDTCRWICLDVGVQVHSNNDMHTSGYCMGYSHGVLVVLYLPPREYSEYPTPAATCTPWSRATAADATAGVEKRAKPILHKPGVRTPSTPQCEYSEYSMVRAPRSDRQRDEARGSSFDWSKWGRAVGKWESVVISGNRL